MKKNPGNRGSEIRLVFNGPVHQVNIYQGSGLGSAKTDSVAQPAPESARDPSGMLLESFGINQPSVGVPYETTPNGAICATGFEKVCPQLRAKVFGNRDVTDPPTRAEIAAAYPTATTIDHIPNNSYEWTFHSLPGAGFSPNKVNFLVVYRVLDIYMGNYDPRTTSFVSKFSYTTWCEDNDWKGSRPQAESHAQDTCCAPHSDHPDIYEISPVECGGHGGRGLATALEGSKFLVRETRSHEDYPAWRSCSVGETLGEWILHQSAGVCGNWHATLRFVPASGDDSGTPKVWASTSSWDSRLGGVVVGAGLPELEIRCGG